MLKEAKELLKKRRIAKKMTQSQLAEKVFVGRTTISMIESNVNYIPSPQLAKLLGKELDFDWTIFFQIGVKTVVING